jgi:hypothetical protein
MIKFIVFAFYLCISVTLLVVLPVLMHPTLGGKRKLLISLVAFIVFVPGGLLIYSWLGVPELAAS